MSNKVTNVQTKRQDEARPVDHQSTLFVYCPLKMGHYRRWFLTEYYTFVCGLYLLEKVTSKMLGP